MSSAPVPRVCRAALGNFLGVDDMDLEDHGDALFAAGDIFGVVHAMIS